MNLFENIQGRKGDPSFRMNEDFRLNAGFVYDCKEVFSFALALEHEGKKSAGAMVHMVHIVDDERDITIDNMGTELSTFTSLYFLMKNVDKLIEK